MLGKSSCGDCWRIWFCVVIGSWWIKIGWVCVCAIVFLEFGCCSLGLIVCFVWLVIDGDDWWWMGVGFECL